MKLVGLRFLKILACTGALTLIVVFTPLVSWWSNSLSGKWTNEHGENLIVLAGSSLDQGILGDDTYGRCVYAITAYREGHYKKIILSGTGSLGPPTSVLMRNFLISHDIPSEILLTETASTSTRENALALIPVLKNLKGSNILLTSDMHTYRASRTFRKAGIPVTPKPFPEGMKRGAHWKGRVSVFFDLIDETAKILYYYWKGWI